LIQSLLTILPVPGTVGKDMPSRHGAGFRYDELVELLRERRRPPAARLVEPAKAGSGLTASTAAALRKFPAHHVGLLDPSSGLRRPL
jgi:hypothetical protein